MTDFNHDTPVASIPQTDATARELKLSSVLTPKAVLRSIICILYKKYGRCMPSSFEKVDQETEFVCKLLNRELPFASDRIERLKNAVRYAAACYARAINIPDDEKLPDFAIPGQLHYQRFIEITDKANEVFLQNRQQATPEIPELIGRVTSKQQVDFTSYYYLYELGYELTTCYMESMKGVNWQNFEQQIVGLGLYLNKLHAAITRVVPVHDVDFAITKREQFSRLLRAVGHRVPFL